MQHGLQNYCISESLISCTDCKNMFHLKSSIVKCLGYDIRESFKVPLSLFFTIGKKNHSVNRNAFVILMSVLTRDSFPPTYVQLMVYLLVQFQRRGPPHLILLRYVFTSAGYIFTSTGFFRILKAPPL